MSVPRIGLCFVYGLVRRISGDECAECVSLFGETLLTERLRDVLERAVRFATAALSQTPSRRARRRPTATPRRMARGLKRYLTEGK